MVGSAQAISAHGKAVHLINTFYFALPCPVTHVIMDRHLHGVTRDGHLPKIHTLDGARGPLVAITAMSGTKVHREVRPRPGVYSPRPGPMRRSRSWMNATRTRKRPLRTNDVVGSTTANTTGNSAGDAATEKDATIRRLGELHRLLNSRKGSLKCHQQEEHRRE